VVVEVEPAEHQAEGSSELVIVRTLQEGVIQGMRLPAGVTVETSPEDAASLVESGVGIIIKQTDVHPDEQVRRAK
jgi:hypothetical protein